MKKNLSVFMKDNEVYFTGVQSMKSVSSRRRQQRKQQTPGDVDSDESESDPDQLTRSRTESSNQLDAGKLKHSTLKSRIAHTY